MRRHVLPVAMVFLIGLFGSVARSADEHRPVRLFDGKTLDGWKKVGGGATYKVEDGTIVGAVGPGANTFLRTETTYRDFRLELDAKLDVPGNSGIQFRSHQQAGENGRVYGYQCEIDPTDRAWTGGIYDEGRRGWHFPLTDHPEAQKAFRRDDWNHFVIEAVGPRLRTWLNGVPCADLIDAEDLEGFIALQVHSGKTGQIRWKNILLTDLGQNSPAPLFDGSTLKGWKPSGGGSWAVENGTIRGSSTASETSHGHLFTDGRYSDFLLRLEFRPTRGDSGVYFRSEEKGQFGIQGVQANIDPEKDTGGLYEIDGRGWLVRPDAAVIRKWLKPGEWNRMAIVAIGPRVVVQVNGHTTADITDPKLPGSGRLALQVHAVQDVLVNFRKIELLPLNGNSSR